MNVVRGEIYKARFPHAAGGRGKKRPVLIVQADELNETLHHAVVAQLTGNLEQRDNPACFFIEASTPEGEAAGLERDSLVCCYLLNLMSEDRLQEKIGELGPETMLEIDACLKVALGVH